MKALLAAGEVLDAACESCHKKYWYPGSTPGQATGTLNADPANDSHVRFYEMSEDDSDQILDWVVGWSDGPLDADGEATALPTLDSSGDFELPNTRTWFRFRGYVSDFPFDFQGNAVVSTNFVIQRSGRGYWIRKVAP